MCTAHSHLTLPTCGRGVLRSPLQMCGDVCGSFPPYSPHLWTRHPEVAPAEACGDVRGSFPLYSPHLCTRCPEVSTPATLTSQIVVRLDKGTRCPSVQIWRIRTGHQPWQVSGVSALTLSWVVSVTARGASGLTLPMEKLRGACPWPCPGAPSMKGLSRAGTPICSPLFVHPAALLHLCVVP